MKRTSSALFTLVVAAAVVACSGERDAGRSVAPALRAPVKAVPVLPANLRNFVPPAPLQAAPRLPSSGRRIRSLPPSPLPAFFNGQKDIGGDFYFLKFQNGTPFGDYTFMTDDKGNPNYIWHQDMGTEYFTDANDGQGGIYFYDFTSGHWFYTSPSFPFPYMYDFYYATTVYYDPITPTPSAGPSYYTSNPRWFYNFKFAQWMKSPPAVAWQAGNSTSAAVTESPYNGQCGNATSSADIVFTLYRGIAVAATPTSTPIPCLRNQLHPKDSNGNDFYLQLNSPQPASYTFTFETVVTLNGNTAYRGNDGAELPGILWQSHGENGNPCAVLEIQNTRFLNVSGLASPYPNAEPTGQPVWSFSTCDYEVEPPNSPTGSPSPVLQGAYNGTDVITQGEDDKWQIDIVPQLRSHSGGPNGGYIQVHRNGNIVFDHAASICWDGEPNCWWNFGPYMYHWDSPPTYYDSRGITVEFKNTTLYKNN